MQKHYPSRKRVNRVVTRTAIAGGAILGLVGTIEVESEPKLVYILPLLACATWLFMNGCMEYKKIFNRKMKKGLTNMRSHDMVYPR